MARETEARQRYKAVGKRLPRPDAAAKVIGKTVYAADLHLPRMLHAKLLASPYAHARILRIDASRARAAAGVEAVLTAADLPPIVNRNPSNRHHVPLAQDEVLFYGQPVAAVLASDPHVAEEALELIEVEYEELPAVLDPMEAMKEGAPPARSPVHDVDRSEEKAHASVDVAQKESEGKGSNVSAQMTFRRGDVEQALAEADTVVEGTWKTGMVHQGYIEPQATIADYDVSGELTIWSSTQGPFWVRDDVSSALGIPESKVRVIVTEVGGGFGGKILLTQLLVSSLAMAVRRPVKLILSRKEDLLAGNPAPQAVVELKTGMKKDGTLTALKARVIYDSGAFPAAPMLPGCFTIGGYYRCPNFEIRGFEVLTNKVSVGALRAPGAPQVTFALENQMDMMARNLGLDPLEVRLKNAVGPGDTLPSGHPYPSIGLRECLERIAETDIWRERDKVKERGEHRGVG
ncbi:MAG: xanthine dehydrogenase family protein molybdopterin-binding subunit, partial [Chloroflexota bacterium]|nr:xanthine dehydrogenase family protein molybdopterin-binding subunit [Chloroflexota bacterium]